MTIVRPIGMIPPIRPKPYNLFLDDSGTKEYSHKYSTTGDGSTPYLVFGGFLLAPSVAGQAKHTLQRLKRDCFGTDEVEIKAHWLRREDQRKKRYLDRFALSQESLSRFTDDVYALIVSLDCKLLACIVDKQAVESKYSHPHYAPSIAYDCLLQRVQMEMQDCWGHVDVTIDDMSGATPKRTQHKENLTRQHRLLKANGSRLQPGMAFNRIKGLSFSDSKSDERLQLADLVAYSVYRQFVDYGDHWETEGQPLPTYEYFARIASKFCRSEDGVIAGWGVVKFPTEKRLRWGIEKSP